MDSKRKNVKKNVFTALGGSLAVGAVVAGIMLTPAVGADFSASDSGRVDISTATLSIDLGDNKGSEDFDLDFTNLKPSEVQHQTFYVTNTGTIPADVKISGYAGDVNSVGAGFQAADYNELKIGVSGYSGLNPSTSFSTLELGSLAPGETRAYSFDVALDQSAGNEWQGASVGGTVTVVLDQQ